MKKLFILLLALVFALPIRVMAENSSDVIRAGDPDSMKIALTFDDGPHPKKTDKILDLLEKHHIRATFFVIGQNVSYYPSVLKREVALGHEIGNHTYRHVLLSKIGEAEAAKEIRETETIILQTSGYQPRLFRPPEGAYTQSALKNFENTDYRVVLWTVDTRDWEGASSDKIIKTVKENVRGGSILLFHDYTNHKAHTLEALETLIPELLQQGYEFVTVSELLDS